MTDRIEILTLRSQLFRSIRNFFYDRGFIEVETPVKIAAPAPEEYSESVRAEGEFLRTSPELAMKGLLSEGFSRIFQIGSCFRAGEHGRRHREEFTMLEFYAAGMEYREQARFTAEFIARAARELFGTTELTYRNRRLQLAECEFLTVREAFLRYGNIRMEDAEKRDCFDEVMVSKIEPELGNGHPTFLCDYPAERASLARLRVGCVALDPALAPGEWRALTGEEVAGLKRMCGLDESKEWRLIGRGGSYV